ncbi:uncharacterized protein LOC106714824 [Papilio machaon]|uniref:uncharacterized protein LOC106714824 n=1 Tax=Papilio machaon TaxID=76193 RepID=UPI001E6634D2|nr:uncharacterized protein LOC106714824 [Papilio machaon]
MNMKNDGSNQDCKFTPPTKPKKVRNPFDKALIERLHKPICSPGMCKIYKKKNNGCFKWDIDQASTLVPADIVACSSQFEPSPDPMLEKIAEEASDRFFSQELVVPSPLETSKKVKPLLKKTPNTSVLGNSLSTYVTKKDVSVQTVLSLPKNLPHEVEEILQNFCTYTQDQNVSGDYVITANDSFRRQLFFEEHSDTEHYDSEVTDDEVHHDTRPPSSYETHSPIVISPDLSQDLVTKGLKRTFGTPLNKGNVRNNKACLRNKALDVVDFGEPCFSPIEFRTPKRMDQESATSSSLASASISPVNKPSSDEEKNAFTSPESDTMATCLDCIIPEPERQKQYPCFCKISTNKLSLKRSASLKDSPTKARRGSNLSMEKRSLSMSSLNRSRSVQKLDFSMDMSIDGSIHNCSQEESESGQNQSAQEAWSIVEDSSIKNLVKLELFKEQSCDIQSSTKLDSAKLHILEETPIKGKSKHSVLSHEISKIRSCVTTSPSHMSLDNSLDSSENSLSLEDNKIDFNNVDLKFLTDLSQLNYNNKNVTTVGESSCSFKRIDSGFNENTFYANASSYYESAIKPSELTVTETSKNINHSALKEISNVTWMRVDSGFKDETSTDSTQFYTSNENSNLKFTGFRFTEAKLEDKENVDSFVNAMNKNVLSMSDIFTEDMKLNCNSSSTPSKNKSRRVNS